MPTTFFDQKEPVASRIRKHLQEIRFAHQQVALQHTVLQQADDFERNGPIGRIANRELRADAAQVQTVNRRARVKHDRDCISAVVGDMSFLVRAIPKA